jgi:hypothetical protein
MRQMFSDLSFKALGKTAKSSRGIALREDEN